jgi:hypothetical protein
MSSVAFLSTALVHATIGLDETTSPWLRRTDCRCQCIGAPISPMLVSSFCILSSCSHWRGSSSGHAQVTSRTTQERLGVSADAAAASKWWQHSTATATTVSCATTGSSTAAADGPNVQPSLSSIFAVCSATVCSRTAGSNHASRSTAAAAEYTIRTTASATILSTAAAIVIVTSSNTV